MAHLFISALRSLLVASSFGDDDCLPGVQMLQLDTRIGSQKSPKNCGHIMGNACDESANFYYSNNCAIHTQGKDCYHTTARCNG